jgi:hypothetical protein
MVLDRYAPGNENFVFVRSQEPEAGSQNLRVELKAAGERKHCADPFWLLAPGFWIPYPAAFWRDIKGAALAW